MTEKNDQGSNVPARGLPAVLDPRDAMDLAGEPGGASLPDEIQSADRLGREVTVTC
jgi:hypothetical protein